MFALSIKFYFIIKKVLWNYMFFGNYFVYVYVLYSVIFVCSALHYYYFT